VAAPVPRPGGRVRGPAAALAVLCALPGCEDSASQPPSLDRSERFGILRDLELFRRSPRLGGPFFLDRFETTRADWRSWLLAVQADRGLDPPDSAPGLGEDAALPMVGIDLHQARAYARWRFGRVPRHDELLHAATGGGLYRRPWGDVERVSWANTQELGVGGLTPVGAFESGRQPGGPFDLLGNAGEWTETPDPRYLPLATRTRSPAAASVRGEIAIRVGKLDHGFARHARVTVPAAPWPLGWLVGVDSARLPRVAPSGWTRPASPTSLEPSHFWAESWAYESRAPGERSSLIGLRVASDPETLVARIAAVADPLSAAEVAALRVFLARDGVRPALREAAQRAPERLAGTQAAARLLREELGR
jgi:hypothetical protein